MEGPGGYQLVGRTIQVWNTWKSTPAFIEGSPWSLRFFDQIRFYPVSADELLEARIKFPHGRYELRVEETTFNLKEYTRFLDSISVEAATFKKNQKEAFNAERERWRQAGLMTVVEPETAPELETVTTVTEGCKGVSSPMTASVFQIVVEKGEMVTDGQKLVVLDAMKTEVVVASHGDGVIEDIFCAQGALVQGGQLLLSVRPTSR
jgi:urea carboxylase